MMKKIKKGLLFGVVISCNLLSFSIKSYATTDTFSSDASVGFEADESSGTDPLDPLDPDKPLFPTDPDNPATGNKGALTIDTLPNIKFGKVKISSKQESYKALNEKPYIQVTDKTGTGAGWTLKAEITPFESSDETGNKILKGGFLRFMNGQLKTTSDNLSGLPIAGNVSFPTGGGSSLTVVSAEKDNGRGTWLETFVGSSENANENVILEVPSAAADAIEYKSTITWVLESSVNP